MNVMGVEPDREIAEGVRERGHAVICGRFPEDFSPNQNFDYLVFNDVFEHLSSPHDCLEASWRHLKDGGLLVINYPCSDGMIYRTAVWMARLGIFFPLERMWQYGFKAPHLSYFNDRNLRLLVEHYGFELIQSQALTTFQVWGLWSRITMDRSLARPVALCVSVIFALLAPFLRALPSDIKLHIYRKTPLPRGGTTHAPPCLLKQ